MKSVKRGSSKGWAEIPTEILDDIVNHLDSDKDYKNSRAVCKSWKSALPYILREQNPRQTPWIVLTYNKTYIEKFCRLANLLNNKSYDLNHPESHRKVLRGSCSGCLLIMDDHKFYLLNPFTGTNIELPPLTGLFDTTEYDPGSEDYIRRYRKFCYVTSKTYIRKVVSNIVKEDFVVVLMCGNRELAYYSKRDSNGIWTKIPTPFQWIRDAVFHKGRLYVIHKFGRLAVVNMGSSSSTRAGIEILVDVDLEQRLVYKTHSLFLVSSKDDLLLVDMAYKLRYKPSSCEPLFRIFKLEQGNNDTEEGLNWSMVNRLGDQVLLLGDNTSVLVPRQMVPGSKGNCIYYSNHFFRSLLNRPHLDVRVFHLKEGNNKENNLCDTVGALELQWVRDMFSSRVLWLLSDLPSQL